MALFVGNLRLEESTQFPAVRPSELGRVVGVHQDGLILAGQVVIEAANEGLSVRGCVTCCRLQLRLYGRLSVFALA